MSLTIYNIFINTLVHVYKILTKIFINNRRDPRDDPTYLATAIGTRYSRDAIIIREMARRERKRESAKRTLVLIRRNRRCTSTTEQRTAGEIKRQGENLCQRLVMPRIYGFDYRRGVRYARGAILYG